MPSILERFRRSWNAFIGRDPTPDENFGAGFFGGTIYRPDRSRLSRNSSNTIIASIYNRIALDVASIDFKHVKLDQNENYKTTVDSPLNNCLTVEANIDQTGRSFIQDIVMTMFDEGVCAVVPVDADLNTNRTMVQEAKIYSIRVGRITGWNPTTVRINLYNDQTGRHEEITLPKSLVGIVENPLYSIMNEPNSTLQRLVRTLNRLDVLNEQNSSGKLDLIIQLPYVVKSEMRKQQAEQRRGEIEDQLVNSKYGIAYTDGTEHITQLNRPVDNNLWQQAKDLTEDLFNQLGLTVAVFNGTANEQELLNYYSRTIEPICSAIADEAKRKFLTQTARSQKQSILFFRDPFKLVPVTKLAEIADKFINGEVLSSNEIRAELGYQPVDTQRANELSNKNINPIQSEQIEEAPEAEEEVNEAEMLGKFLEDDQNAQ